MSKPKAINFELIDRDAQSEPYAVLDEMRGKWHRDIAEANIALAWRENLEADKDGHIVLGKCVKASDLQRELVEYDYVILLNYDAWGEFSDAQRRALMDHELAHAAPSMDEDNVIKRDERGRPVWRTRAHDIEEFQSVVEHHGCYKHDIEKFAEELLRKRATPLLDQLTEADDPQCSISTGGKELWRGTSSDLKHAADALKQARA